jgi:hypothetical protein
MFSSEEREVITVALQAFVRDFKADEWNDLDADGKFRISTAYSLLYKLCGQRPPRAA